jgi:hypothetical protein
MPIEPLVKERMTLPGLISPEYPPINHLQPLPSFDSLDSRSDPFVESRKNSRKNREKQRKNRDTSHLFVFHYHPVLHRFPCQRSAMGGSVRVGAERDGHGDFEDQRDMEG